MKDQVKRLPKDEKYYFIKLSELKPCVTVECYLDSDNLRFETGNYFLTHSAVSDVADTLHEKFDKPISANRHNTVLNEHWFIKTVISFKEKYRLSRKDAELELAAQALVKTIAKYQQDKYDLAAERKKINDEINAIIKRAAKV